MEILILTKRPDFVAMTTVYSCTYLRYAFRCQNQLLNTMIGHMILVDNIALK